MNNSPTVAASWMSAADLSRVLGGPNAARHQDADETDVWPVIRVRLAPGDVLYQQGSRSAYGYIVLDGVIQCTRRGPGQAQQPDAVTHVGAHDLLGVQAGAAGGPETACALTAVELMALPAEAWSAFQASSEPSSERVARPLGQALMRDLRVLYRLRDLPPYARLVAGLHHLVGLMRKADAGLEGPQVPVSIDTPTLARWLDLDVDGMAVDLARLQRYGALHLHGEVVTTLVPEVIDTVAGRLPKNPPAREQVVRSGVATAGMLMMALLCTLLLSVPAQAAVQAAVGVAGAGAQVAEVPWGFVCFSGAVLLASHLWPRRR